MSPALTFEQNSFTQFVFDNTNFNTNTLDGLSTFHAMGGIPCMTPRTAIAPDQEVGEDNEDENSEEEGINLQEAIDMSEPGPSRASKRNKRHE
ncbi:hypothetical protein WA026_001223 [Henosepilachna vigintioctopunctata]|uniref:Uncharacterized protein n=1 Tax=Henosepilachna vigintioctopunctata TaxID=420089 RepID=A0AAW1UST4_9CUCU